MCAFSAKDYFGSRINVMELVLFFIFSSTFTIDQIIAGKFVYNNPDELYWTNKFAFLTAFRGLRMVLVM